MKLKGMTDVDVVNYKKTSMFLIFPYCTFKCDKENGCSLCQNSHLAGAGAINVKAEDIIEQYINNPLSHAIVCGGLEPFDTPEALIELLNQLRVVHKNNDDFVIYTGYTEEELVNTPIFYEVINYKNIVIKFGRFRPNELPHMDNVLGVKLSSNNQYAVRYV